MMVLDAITNNIYKFTGSILKTIMTSKPCEKQDYQFHLLYFK